MAGTVEVSIVNLISPDGLTEKQITIPNGGNILIDGVDTVSQLAQKPNSSNAVLTGTVDLQGGQIKFPATQSASSDPNTLDDYEEGTFTPALYGFVTAGIGTYDFRNGYYTKIGNLVFFNLNLYCTSHTGTGGMSISGLPFTVQNDRASVSVITNALTLTTNAIAAGFAEKSSNAIRLYQQLNGSLSDIPIDTTCVFYISGCYQV